MLEDEFNITSLPSILEITSWGAINKSKKGKRRGLIDIGKEHGESSDEFNVASLPAILGIASSDSSRKSSHKSKKGKKRRLASSTNKEKSLDSMEAFLRLWTASPTIVPVDGFNATYFLSTITGWGSINESGKNGKRRGLIDISKEYGESSESADYSSLDYNFTTGTLSPAKTQSNKKSGKKRRLKSSKKPESSTAPPEEVFIMGNATIAPGSRRAKAKRGQRLLPSSDLYDFYYK